MKQVDRTGCTEKNTQFLVFFSFLKRDIAPDQDPFAFYLALHIASMSVRDAVKVLPSWWSKARGCAIHVQRAWYI